METTMPFKKIVILGLILVTNIIQLSYAMQNTIPEKVNLGTFMGSILYGIPIRVQALIDQKADVNTIVDREQNFTPLLHAIKRGNSDIITVLLQNGAKHNIYIYPKNDRKSSLLLEACI